MKRSPHSPTIDATHTLKKAKTEDDEGWTKVEKRKQKKAAKKQKLFVDQNVPKFMYSNSDIVQRHRAIGIEEIRDVVLHILADAPPPNWVRIQNAHLIPKVVTLFIPGLTHDILNLPPLPTSATSNPNVPIAIPLPPRQDPSDALTHTLHFISSTFSHACPTRAPGDDTRMHSTYGSFFNVPVSSAERKRRQEVQEASEREHGKDPVQYMLTLEQMMENDYPIPTYMADVFDPPADWVQTPEEPKHAEEKPSLLSMLDEKKPSKGLKRKVYAIDCEMCLTEDGKELTRVCIVDYESGIRLYDQLVKPTKPILDYLTKWSGIKPGSLDSVTTTLAQVQQHILKLLSPPAQNPFSTTTSTPSSSSSFLTPILLGHSLENDLKALKLAHPFCVDTALLYHHPRGRPLKPGLAWLTNKWCGRAIQTLGDGGHDPEEDSRACIELLQKKITEGPSFGEFKVDYESIFERMKRATRRAGVPGQGAGDAVRSVVVDWGNPAAMHGNKATSAIGCESDEQVFTNVLENLEGKGYEFVFARFMGLANVLGWTTPKANANPHGTAQPTDPSPLTENITAPPSAEVLSPVLAAMNAYLKTIFGALPSRTALIIFTGHSDPRRMAALTARKNAFETAIKTGRVNEETGLKPEERWTSAHVRELEEAVERAKRGLLFLGLKN